ncbi:hypothetical protein N7499_009977 [Penicillium canescens]|uniref:Hyaluronan/mRNA-binding protein domain-containing protein n=1 Tax=Penicillium canescens TaxID=5083 RepID=A0AAD6IMJ3_PENCN|nr:hypothetical protein N7460_000380 [Penicillium canescens]KAJ6071963.1 hypothetical protein N7499_009977 [Penicillium canescens]KAJ6083065.1 hypothetical protein N7467_007200 [Penicillium canescens]KAJ6170641.1 hypothetical protein N7485_007987 [Penicillium canescens]
MADVRSKNLYELLGNDPELDPSRPAPPPTRAVDRTADRSGKRDTPKEPAARHNEANARRGGRVTAGNEAAFRDRNAGRNNNREKPTDEAAQPARRRGGGGRGDRQSRTGQTDTRKQVQQGWGAESGEKTWDDERQGEKIAKNEEAEPQTPADEEAKEEPDNSKSFADYLAEKAQKETLAAKPVRAANEGSKLDKKWAEAKELAKDDEESYIAGSGEKTKREKQRKEKNFLDVDLRYVEPPRSGPAPRGGRGGRGDRGDRPARGGERGARGGDRAPRGDRPPRGAPRGGAPAARGGAPRGAARGPAGPTVDEKNFPSLGGN